MRGRGVPPSNNGLLESRDKRDLPREMWVASSNNFGGGEYGTADWDERGCNCGRPQS